MPALTFVHVQVHLTLFFFHLLCFLLPISQFILFALPIHSNSNGYDIHICIVALRQKHENHSTTELIGRGPSLIMNISSPRLIYSFIKA